MNRDQQLPDIWNSRDLPVLRTVARMIETEQPLSSQEIAAAAGLTQGQTVNALRNLSHRHLRTSEVSSFGGDDYMVNAVLPLGLEAVGQWPSPEAGADRLLAALDALIDETAPDSPKGNRLRNLRDNLLSVGRDVLVNVASSVISGRIPT